MATNLERRNFKKITIVINIYYTLEHFYVARYSLFNYFTSIEDSHTKYLHYQMTKPLSVQVRIIIMQDVFV